MLIIHFLTSRKLQVSWRFQGIYKWNIGLKWVNNGKCTKFKCATFNKSYRILQQTIGLLTPCGTHQVKNQHLQLLISTSDIVNKYVLSALFSWFWTPNKRPAVLRIPAIYE